MLGRGCSPWRHRGIVWSSNTHEQFAADPKARELSLAASLVLVPAGAGGLALVHVPTGRTVWKRRKRQLPDALRPWPCPW